MDFPLAKIFCLCFSPVDYHKIRHTVTNFSFTAFVNLFTYPSTSPYSHKHFPNTTNLCNLWQTLSFDFARQNNFSDNLKTHQQNCSMKGIVIGGEIDWRVHLIHPKIAEINFNAVLSSRHVPHNLTHKSPAHKCHTAKTPIRFQCPAICLEIAHCFLEMPRAMIL